MVWIGSPFFTPGRPQPVSKIVLHWMNGTLAGTDAMFQTGHVSAHYGIENTTVHQYVLEVNQAWHAISANPFSIGVEHSAAPGRSATKSTLETSAKLCAEICKRYKLNPLTDIQTHNHYVATRCPGTSNAGVVLEAGGLDVNYIRKRANELLKGEQMIADTDANYKLFNRLRSFVLGSGLTRTEFRKAYVGKSYRSRLDAIVNHSGAGKPTADLRAQLGAVQLALKQANAALDNAKQQYDIKGDLAKQLEASQHKNDQLIAQLEELKAEKTTRDEAVNSLWTTIGDFLNRILGR